MLAYDQYVPEEQPLREALCALGNGYFVTRGAAEEKPPGGNHYPGTYIAGGYNRLPTQIAGRVIENEDLVNWPNWLPLTFKAAGGPWFDIDEVELLEFRQELDLRAGVLRRNMRFRDVDGRETAIESRRFVHMEEEHLAGQEWTLTPLNWSGPIVVRSAIDGTVQNDNVERYRELNGHHVEVLDVNRFADDSVDLLARSCQSRIEVAVAVRTRVFRGDDRVDHDRETSSYAEYMTDDLRFEVRENEPVRIEKIAALHTSKDRATSEPQIAARKTLSRAPGFEDLLTSQKRAWARLWRRFETLIEATDGVQRIVNVHVFHLLQTASFNTIGLDVGIPARGWHGEAYRGHIFWDELFIFPFLNLRVPEITRSLLMYRYRRLDEAKQRAEAIGRPGALYPWQSGSDGRDESQVLHLNPKSGRWIPDNTHLQYHINAAIAFNIHQYFAATDDLEFLSFYGGEMLLRIAQFWADYAEFNPERDRYEITGVVGPDEYHTAYPGSDEPGLRNNAYTNVMAAWSIRTALRVFQRLREDRQNELLDSLEISSDDLEHWREVSRRMYVPFHEDGVISQFEGYESLQEFDWGRYREKYGSTQRLDRILGAENDTPNRYQVGKQADVLMLFYLFSCEELLDLFDHLDYDFRPEWIPRNVDYYLKRTSHGSTLSRAVYAWVLARSDREGSWTLLREALRSDVEDIQGGTTPEGIHLGAMAGTVDIVQRCYLGIEMRDDVLWFNPALPRPVEHIALTLRYRGHWLSVSVNAERLKVVFHRGWAPRAKVGFDDEVYTFEEGESREFQLDDRHADK